MSDERDRPRTKLNAPKHDGARGDCYYHWEKQLLDAAELYGDEDASWASTMLGTDPAAGLSPAQVRRRRMRQREGYAAIMELQTDESLREVLRAEANRNSHDAIQILRRECAAPDTALCRVGAWKSAGARSGSLPFSHALIKAVYVIRLGATPCHCISSNIRRARADCLRFSQALIRAL